MTSSMQLANRICFKREMRDVKSNRVLRELWKFGVNPLLDELGFTQMLPPGKSWPRVWWVANGILNVLPIHAAG